MKISILTLFPEMFSSAFEHSIIKRAKDKNLAQIDIVNIRDFGIGNHKMVDDTPYGGGAGMVLRVDVLKNAIDYAKCKNQCDEKIILLDAGGETYNQNKAYEFANTNHLILICGHYEGVDQRIKKFVDTEISIGDFILTGGEIPAIAITDSVIRLLKGVLGKDESSKNESFQDALVNGEIKKILEYPQYTKPQEFEGEKIPDVLLSGNHKNIENWRMEKAIEKTKIKRPDLLK